MTARRYALGATVATGAAALVYRLGRPLISRIGARFARRGRGATAARDLSAAIFEQLHQGMSAAALVRVLGPHYREVNRSEMPGAQTRTLVWATADGRVVHAVLQNDRLVAKVQRGLG